MPQSPFPSPIASTPAPVSPFSYGDTAEAASLPSMPSTFTPAFEGLSGDGPTLKTLTASTADVVAKRVVQGMVDGQLKSYQVRAGTDAEDLPGIVRPANYDADTNAVVFVQV